MINIIPAIDLKDGKVVRLTRGDYNKVKVYSDDPAGTAKRWQACGARMLHIVDLDGALAGRPKNADAFKAIAQSVDIPIELGGGIRDRAAIDAALALGASRVVIGTRAAEDIDFAAGAVAEYKDKVIISIDARDGVVMLEGWTKASRLSAVEMAGRARALGASAVIYTDIALDGTLKGPNLGALGDFLDGVDIAVTASGGISSIEDIKNLRALERKNLNGIIVGKALYENAVDLKEAIRICSRNG